MKTTMETLTPVIKLQAAMVFALIAGASFGFFTADANFSALSLIWLSACGLVVTYGPMIAIGTVITAFFLRGSKG